MYKNTRHNRKNKHNYIGLLAVAVIVFLLVASSGAYLFTNRNKLRITTEQPSPSTDNYVNLSPPTEEDKEEAEQNKENLAYKVDQPKPKPTSNVSPIITYAGQYEGLVEAAGYAPGIYEDGGLCTYVFLLGQQKVSREVKTFKDVRNTACNPISIERKEFPTTGSWKLILSYSSSSTKGSSDERTVEVK